MATTPASGGDHSILVDPTASCADAAGGERSEEQHTESSADMARKLKILDMIVLCVAFLEWAGNAVGTLASLWATVVLLGGFCSLLSRKDFWFSTVMIFLEATRVFIRNDALVNQWLFGSTSAFRWKDLSSRPMLVTPKRANSFALIIGLFVTLVPPFRPEIVTSIVKVALLVIISQMLSRLRGRVALYLLRLFGVAAFFGGNYGFYKSGAARRQRKGMKVSAKFAVFAWEVVTCILVVLAVRISRCAISKRARALIPIKAITALALACLPLFQPMLASYYGCLSITVSLVLLQLSNPVKPRARHAEMLIFQIVDTIMPILFFWSVMFPLPGISLKLSFYMLISAIAAVLVGNLKIPVAFLQVLLSILRLQSLLGHHRHDYRPLPPDASPNLVPSIVVFFMLELFQGSSYLIATLLWLLFLPFRGWIARASGFKEEWGAKAVILYFRQAYQARTEKGLLHSEKRGYTRSLDSFAIESLGDTSSDEMQIVGLRILDNCLERGDSKSNKKLITEIVVKDAKNIITKIIGLISYLIDAENSGDPQQKKEDRGKRSDFKSIFRDIVEPLKRPFRLLFGTNISGTDELRESRKKEREQKEVVRLSLKFVRRLAINGGKISARFRQELSENPFLLDSLEQILNMEDCQLELWEPAMDIIAVLALDEAARQEIGSTQSIIRKLIHAFVRPDDVNNPSRNDNDRSLRKAAGEALANLTMKSTDNCWAILLAEQGHNLIEKLIVMLDDEYYICVAANLLNNLCANSRDKLMEIGLGASVQLESALPKVMQIIMTSEEGKQLEAALCVTSQIGYVIPKCFRKVLISYTDAAALVEKLVDTLNSNKEPRPEYPRIRRVLVEVVISIVRLCPDPYRTIFREKKAKDALDMVKGTPSRLERYRVIINGEGVLPESLPMRGLVDKAKKLIYRPTPTTSAEQAGEHA